MDNLIIYSKGLVSMSVCVDNSLTKEQIERLANAKNPTGTSSRWHISKNKTFKDGASNPCPCHDLPDKRKHYLLNC